MAWQLDPYHTQVEFAVKHLGMMTVRGHFTDVVSSGTIDPDNPANSSFEVTIDVASLKTHNPQRDNDLKSSNFLELEKYPTITFKSTKIGPAGSDRYTMTGDLTIKGVTRPVTLQVMRYGEFNDPMMGHRIAYSAEGKINRRDFGLTFDAMLDGRLVVGNDVNIQIEVEAVEKKPEEQKEQAAAAARA
jgi:polyisoprenoid-binding protein YceI